MQDLCDKQIIFLKEMKEKVKEMKEMVIRSLFSPRNACCAQDL